MSSDLPKALLLVDVQNAYYTTRDTFSKPLNYKQLWAHVAQRFQIQYAFAYAIEPQDSKQKSFQNILRTIGFEVKLKPYIQRQDGSAKGDWDVGITVDAMRFAAEVDVVVLVSGDGDFDILVSSIRQQYEKQVEVFGVRQLTAHSLIRAANHFHEIDHSLLMP